MKILFFCFYVFQFECRELCVLFLINLRSFNLWFLLWKCSLHVKVSNNGIWAMVHVVWRWIEGLVGGYVLLEWVKLANVVVWRSLWNCNLKVLRIGVSLRKIEKLVDVKVIWCVCLYFDSSGVKFVKKENIKKDGFKFFIYTRNFTFFTANVQRRRLRALKL